MEAVSCLGEAPTELKGLEGERGGIEALAIVTASHWISGWGKGGSVGMSDDQSWVRDSNMVAKGSWL